MSKKVLDKEENIEDNYTYGYLEISADCSNCLKGIFAVCVLVHHLYQHIVQGFFLTLFHSQIINLVNPYLFLIQHNPS